MRCSSAGRSSAAKAVCPDVTSRVAKVEQRVQAGDVEDLAHGVLSTDDHEPITVGLAKAFERADEDSESGRVDESDAA